LALYLRVPQNTLKILFGGDLLLLFYCLFLNQLLKYLWFLTLQKAHIFVLFHFWSHSPPGSNRENLHYHVTHNVYFDNLETLEIAVIQHLKHHSKPNDRLASLRCIN